MRKSGWNKYLVIVSSVLVSVLLILILMFCGAKVKGKIEEEQERKLEIQKDKEETDIANIRAAKALAVTEFLMDNENQGIYLYDADKGKLMEAEDGRWPKDFVSKYSGKGYGRGDNKDYGCSPYFMRKIDGVDYYYTGTCDVVGKVLAAQIISGEEDETINLYWIDVGVAGETIDLNKVDDGAMKLE